MPQKLNQTLNSLSPYFFLFLACLYFCHRFYGIFLPIEFDVPQGLYEELHRQLIRADHNPFHWYYSSYLPVSDNFNPVLFLSRIFTDLVFSEGTIAGALFINILTSLVCLWLLAASVFLFCRYLGRSVAASLLGAIVVSFTGFHCVNGVRLFDPFYLVSFCAVGPVLICFDKISRDRSPRFWITLAAILIGISLLSGTNFPLFPYLIVALFLPFIDYLNRRNSRALIRSSLYLVLSTILGVLSAAAYLLPAFIYLKDTNRAHLTFYENIADTSAREKLLSVLFRDFWVDRILPGSAIDFFLGLPVVILILFGISETKQDLKNSPDKRPLIILLFLCLLNGIVLLNFGNLPREFQTAMAWFYGSLSIRYPQRFFLLLLVPVAYLAARGLEATLTRRKLLLGLFLLLAYVVLGLKFIPPRWATLIPDQKWAFLFSQSLALLATVTILGKANRNIRAVLLFSLFGMYVFAPLQMTAFPSALMNETRKVGLYYPQRYGLRQFLGLDNNYPSAIARLTDLFTVPPPWLKDPQTKVGRIFEGIRPNQRTISYYAPYTGHRFIFTNPDDPASPARITELSQWINDPILDLTNTCWKLSENSLKETVAISRKTCLPEAFLVPAVKKAKDAHEALSWISHAKTEDFLQFASIDCSTEDCRSLSTEAWPVAQDGLQILKSEPGSFLFQVNIPRPALLFLSTAYRFDWTADVNSRSVKPLRANHAFLAVPLEAGQNLVQLSLSSPIRRISGMISLLMLALGLFFGIADWLRCRPKSKLVPKGLPTLPLGDTPPA